MGFIEEIEYKRTEEDYIFLDYARFIASIAVIIMHVMINITKDFSTPGDIFGDFISFNFFSNFIFFLATGFSSMKYKEDITIKTTCGLIIKRYVGLMLFAIPYNFIESLWTANCIFEPVMIKNALCKAPLGYTWDHLWFMFMLLGVYLFMPFLIKIYKNKNKELLPVFVLILSVLCFLGVSMWIDSPIYMFHWIPFSNVILCVSMGAYIYRYNFFDKLNKWVNILIVCVMILLWFKCTVIFRYINRSFFTILFAVMLFALCKKVFTKKNKIISLFASHNYIIYLIHVFYLHLLTKVIRYNPYKKFGATGIIIATIVIYMFSLLSAIIIENIPYVGKLYCKKH